MGTTNTYSSTYPRKMQQSMRLLSDLQPKLLFGKFGARDTLNQRTGKKAVFRRYFSLPSPVAQSGEGETAIGQQITYEDVTFNIVHFMSKVPLTKDMQLFHEDDLEAVGREKIPQQLSETDDIYMFYQCRAGTSVRYAGGVASRLLVTSAPTRTDFDLIVRDLTDVPRISKIVTASMDTDTHPVKAAYVAFFHPHLAADIANTTGFILAENYGKQELLDPEELGTSPSGIRFLPSSLIKPWLAAATSISVSQTTYLANGVAAAGYPDVYPILVFGEEAFGHLNLKSYRSMDVSVIRPGSDKAKTVNDPTGENGCVAAELYTGGGILDERRLVRYECACSARPGA